MLIDCPPQRGGSLSINQLLNFGILLVNLVGELLYVCVIFADANEINLQLEWPISFISQGKSNGVYLEIQRHAVIKKAI